MRPCTGSSSSTPPTRTPRPTSGPPRSATRSRTTARSSNNCWAPAAVPAELTVESHGRRAFRDLIAVRHPDDPYEEASGTGLGRRLLFQRVPEPKTVKNRLHLDLHAGAERREAEVARLEGLGASVLRQVKEPGGEWVVMTDPEGNEFCVQ